MQRSEQAFGGIFPAGARAELPTGPAMTEMNPASSSRGALEGTQDLHGDPEGSSSWETDKPQVTPAQQAQSLEGSHCGLRGDGRHHQ